MEDLKLDENSTITIPVRNLIAMIFATAVAVMGYFEVTNRIAVLERETMLFEQEMKQNSEFRVKWPRGELGSLPDDMMQNAQLMTIHQRLEEITQIKDHMNELRIDLNKENGINQTQHEKLETLFALWNEQIIKKEN